jgi:plasmanylethanolamine desaturase
LAQGYSRTMRKVEVASLLLFGVVFIALAVRLAPHAPQNPWLLLAAGATGYLGADFVSGLVHWAADTWGTTATPVLGKSVLRPFREHHVNQEAITHHDFVETSGNSCFVCIPAATGALFLPMGPGLEFSFFCASFLEFLVLWTLGTNQFHKWAHLKHPPVFISWLQRLHLILPPAHHAIHHTAPFNRYYCITVGWMNRPLTWMRFFPALEAIISWLTGAIPRSDDIGVQAALAVASSETTPINPAEAPRVAR